MSVNSVRVRNKPAKTRARSGRIAIVLPIAATVVAVVAVFLYEFNYGRLGLIGPQPVIEQTAAGKVIKVPPGGNVQRAIELADSGDIVELQAGAVYSGTVNLPNKPLTDFVTIRTSSHEALPADKRVSPAQRLHMAKITAGILGRPAVSATNGAHHYRFIGIEFAPSSSFYNYGLVRFGNGERPENLPHTLEIDRSYIHPHTSGKVRRGIALNSANTVIKNSYIEGIAFEGEETQGICGWTGTRNVKILNNYIEGGAENIMFGGADPDSPELIPTDILVEGNDLNKPAAWKSGVTVKTLFELKNSKRVRFIGNRLTNNWIGSAFRITIRNQDGNAPFSTIEDIVIRDNVIDGSGDGINILGKDDTHPSRVLKDLTIENNLFLNISGNRGFEGGGYFIQVNDGDGITIANNTVFNNGSIIKFYGVTPRNFVFRDNIVSHGDYGVHGLDLKSASGRAMVTNNVIINLNGVPPGDFAFPEGNFLVSDLPAVGFLNADAKDYRLSGTSAFRGKGANGRDLGSTLTVGR